MSEENGSNNQDVALLGELPVVEEYGLPRPTPWPAVLASGVALAVWGLFVGQIVAATGLFLLAVSLIGWIRELRRQALATRRMQDGEADVGRH
jgi:hypothetical protein